MCTTVTKLRVLTADGWRDQDIDQCIEPIVKALNRGDIHTVSCCCGHGKELGHIWLEDGRVLVILPSEPSKEEVVDIITSRGIKWK
jgi:hypothetical protein